MSLYEQKEVMLNILIEFSKFCDEHHLMYYLDAGTLIGAVRHKGFIPWDDDIDINMPQIDYHKFINLVKEMNYYIGEYLKVELPKEHLYPYIKISDTRTILVEFPEQNPMEVAVYIDVFPKYGIKDKKWFSKSVCKVCEYLNLIHWFNNYSVDAWQRKENNVVKRLFAKMAKVLTWNKAWASDLQECIMISYAKKHPLDKCKYVTTLTNGEFHKLAPKECFDGFQWLEFEGHQFKGPKDYDTYLHCLYKGDYMQLPPTDQRIHHITEVYWK